MRTKTLVVFRAIGRWVGRLLDVRLPWDVVAGLRTRR